MNVALAYLPWIVAGLLWLAFCALVEIRAALRAR